MSVVKDRYLNCLSSIWLSLVVAQEVSITQEAVARVVCRQESQIFR